MVNMNNGTKVGIVFVISGCIASVVMGFVLNAMPFTLMSGVPISLFSFFWAKYLLKNFEFGSLKKIESLETRGVSYGLAVITLSILSSGVLVSIASIFNGPLNIFLLILGPLGHLALVSFFSFGIPYILGGLIGWWSAHFIFNQIHHTSKGSG